MAMLGVGIIAAGAWAMLTAQAETPRTQRGPERQEIPPPLTIECPRATSPVIVDGALNEQAWREAPAVTEFRLWYTLTPPTEKTSVRLCYDDRYFYAFFECADPDIFALHDTRDAALWESDAVALFLKPEPKNPIYWQFEIGPNNTVFDARAVNTGSGGRARWAAWDCAIKTAVHVDGTLNNWRDRDRGYAVELAIPLEVFREVIGQKPLAGQSWQFAAARADFSVTLEAEECSATANVPGGDIHEKDGYFTLLFK